ncbi:NAD-dependent epimerase/dehydratase family protein [Streptomyces sp. NPDC002133]|uniref:NAD-dependent epimerase/dehydratase family protein n=1 Tax=Streptomyces sp. NPDC002133 TaxID=3154409 RepID=UPI003333EB89
MRVVVAGATGLIGARTVARLRDHGVEVVPVSRGEGVDVITGDGLAQALGGAGVVVDVTDAPSRAEETSPQFFDTATTNHLGAATPAGDEYYVIRFVVGAEHREAAGCRRRRTRRRHRRTCPVLRRGDRGANASP